MSRIRSRALLLTVLACLSGAGQGPDQAIASQVPPPQGQPPAVVPAIPSAQLLRTFEHDATVWKGLFSPDGKLVATCTDAHVIRIWDPATGKELHKMPVEGGGAVCLSFSPDSKVLASAPGGGVTDFTPRLWDVATGKELRRLKGHQDTVYAIAFSPDGRKLATTGRDKTVRLWDAASGNEIAKLEGHTSNGLRIDFSPDNQTVASGGDDGTVRLWDVNSKKEIRQLSHGTSVYCVTFSPDGRMIAATGYNTTRVWEVASGKELRQFGSRDAGGCWTSFSPDGAVLVGCGNDKVVHLWEVATGLELRQFTGHERSVKCAVFSPDGKTLVSSAEDHKVFLWDVTGLRKADGSRPVELTAARLEGLWTDLAGTDALKAYQAGWTLAIAPAQSIPFLQEKLKVTPRLAVKPERVAQWIKELDDDSFPVREQASTELEKVGDQAAAALRQALEKKPSLEAQRRIEDLLSRLDTQVLPPEHLQMLRGVAVVERAGTPAARQLLEKLARGPSDLWLTREAKLALARLEHRPSR